MDCDQVNKFDYSYQVEPIKFAYLANIVILTPIAVPTLLNIFDTCQKRLKKSLDGGFWLDLFGRRF
jgi:hypothetical protein